MKSPFDDSRPPKELDEAQKSEALYTLHICAQAVRQRLAKFIVDGKRPSEHDLESMAGVLFNAERIVIEMSGGKYDVPMPFFPDDWSPEVARALRMT